MTAAAVALAGAGVARATFPNSATADLADLISGHLARQYGSELFAEALRVQVHPLDTHGGRPGARVFVTLDVVPVAAPGGAS